MTIDLRRAMSHWQTIRVATRTWRRTPALAIVIVCTLALGIGATTTAFTIAYSILVQQFPFPDADRLVWITTYDSRTDGRGRASMGSNRLPQFADWQQHLKSFEQIGAWAGEAPDVFTVTGAGTPERVSGLRVTHQLLPMLGATPDRPPLPHRRRCAGHRADRGALARLLAAALRRPPGHRRAVGHDRERTSRRHRCDVGGLPVVGQPVRGRADRHVPSADHRRERRHRWVHGRHWPSPAGSHCRSGGCRAGESSGRAVRREVDSG